jgi:hypothetical protein
MIDLGRWDERFCFAIRGWEGANWQDYILDPNDGDDRYDWREVDDVSGIYALWSEIGELLYVGMATNIQSRALAHWRKGTIPFESLTLSAVPVIAMWEVEVAHIQALRPPFNRLFEQSHWIGHPIMVDAIRLAWGAILRGPECC